MLILHCQDDRDQVDTSAESRGQGQRRYCRVQRTGTRKILHCQEDREKVDKFHYSMVLVGALNRVAESMFHNKISHQDMDFLSFLIVIQKFYENVHRMICDLLIN